MKPFSDTDLIDFLKCPAGWFAKYCGKFTPTADLVSDYFTKYITNDDTFAQWNIDHAAKLFYTSGGGGLKKEYLKAQGCAERVLMDPLVSGYYENSEMIIKIDTMIHDVPFRFSIPGVDMDKQTLAIAALGPYKLSMKKQHVGRSGHPQWLHWLIADEYPALSRLYTEALWNQLCLTCKPFVIAVENSSLPDYMVYDCHEISANESDKVYWGILEMQAYAMQENDPANLTNCGFCEYCRTTKKISEPKVLTYTI